MKLQPIYITVPFIFDEETINEVNALLAPEGFKAVVSEDNNQHAIVKITHPMDARGIVNAMVEFGSDYAIFEGVPDDYECSNQIA